MKHDTLAPWAERVPDTHPMTADGLLRLDDDEWQYELVTLPTAEAGGFSSPAIRQTSYMPGVHRNYGAPLRVASILGSIQDDRECFTRWRIIQRNAANTQLERSPKGAGPKATKHGFIARANMRTVARRLPSGKGPFTPLPEGRGPLAPRW